MIGCATCGDVGTRKQSNSRRIEGMVKGQIMETVGFIGLGLMGKPMAQNLIKAGYPLVVHNRSRQVVQEFAAQGVRTADSLQQVAQDTEIVITMLTAPANVAEVLGGEEGVIANARPGTIVIDMSSSHPTLARELAAQGVARGVSVLDAPVSGGEVGAREATLSIMVGGEEEAFERALPLFRCMGKNIVRVGDAGAGQVVKIANQIIVGLTIEAVAEALNFVDKAGADVSKARQVMMGGFATSRVLEVHGKRMEEHNFVPGARATVHLKDLGMALDVAQGTHANLPITARVAEMYRELVERGFGGDDHSALWRVVAEDWR